MTDADVIVIGGSPTGLATAHVATTRGLRPLVLDAGAAAGRSWPHYHDSLTLFSPARFSALPGKPFHADPNRHPVRDEVVDYLTTYTAQLDAPMMFGQRMHAATRTGDGFQIRTDAGPVTHAQALVTASGGFGRPHRPDIPSLDTLTGTVLHSAEYRSPTTFDDAWVVLISGGNSAAQIAAELATTAASASPPGHRCAGNPSTSSTTTSTGGWPKPASTPLDYVGLERQRSLASTTLRGIGRDAAHVLAAPTTPTDRTRRRHARHRRP
jgi:putative flavoprotein involved in K+ transport